MNKYIIFLLIFLPYYVSADTISTAVKNGSVLELTGSFTVDLSPLPLVYENYETNDVGRQNGDQLRTKNCSDFGSWEDISDDYIPIYTSSNNRTGSTLCGYHNHDVTAAMNDVHAPASIIFSGTTETTILLSVHLRYVWAAYTGTGNYKQYRINGGTELDSNLAFHAGSGNNDPARGFFMGGANGIYPEWPGQEPGDPTLNFDYANDGEWEHHIVMMKASTNGGADGRMILWRNGAKLEDTSTMITWRTGQDWNQLTFGWDVVNYSTGIWELSTDDIYLANTFRSVWLCNNAVWENSTHKELLITELRGATDINAIWNPGSFTSETVYAIVLDSDGVPSNGVEVISSPSTATTIGVISNGTTRN